MQGIEGVGKIKDGYNPATWALEVTTSSEAVLGINFNDVYRNSELYRFAVDYSELYKWPSSVLGACLQEK